MHQFNFSIPFIGKIASLRGSQLRAVRVAHIYNAALPPIMPNLEKDALRGRLMLLESENDVQKFAIRWLVARVHLQY